MSRLQASVDGEHWLDLPDHVTVDGALAGGNFREVRVVPDAAPAPDPVHYRRVPCATCGKPVTQQSWRGKFQTPDHARPRCDVCMTDLDRPTRNKIVGRVVRGVELSGRKLTLAFDDGCELEVEAPSYDDSDLDVHYRVPRGGTLEVDLPAPFTEIPAICGDRLMGRICDKPVGHPGMHGSKVSP